MTSRLLAHNGQKVFAVIFDSSDEVAAGLAAFAERHHLGAAHFSAIGGSQSVTLGYYEWEDEDHKKIEVDEQVEVLSMVGDIALENGHPTVHAGVLIGKADGSVRRGHLVDAHVRPAIEAIVTEVER